MKNTLFKRILAFVLAFAMIISGITISENKAMASDDLTDYQSMSWEEILAREENLTWVFAGDSITHCASHTAGLNSYVDSIEQRLLEMDRKGDAVFNTARGGKTIKEIYEDINNFLIKYNPDVVFIKIGMNDRRLSSVYDGADFDTRVEKFKEYYQMVIDEVLANGKTNGKIPKITLISTAPRSSDTFLNMDQYDEDSCWPMALAAKEVAEHYGLQYIDLMTAFCKQAEICGDDYAYMYFSDDSDGATHPNQVGQYLIFKTVSEAIGIYDENSLLYQLEEEDLKNYSLYPELVLDETTTEDSESEVTTNEALTTAFSASRIWAYVGAEQMSTVESVDGHRSLARTLEGVLRKPSANRKVRMLNASAPGYTMSYLEENYEELIGQYNPYTMFLLPEVSAVYADGYEHTDEKVAAYKEDVTSLLNKDGITVKILLTPIPSTDATINSYLNDYAKAVREIAEADSTIAFVDLNEWVSGYLDNDSAVRNWFGTDMNLRPVAILEFAEHILTELVAQGLTIDEYETSYLYMKTNRESTDTSVFPMTNRIDNIEAEAKLDGMSVTVNIEDILNVYPELENVSFALLPATGVGNYNKKIQKVTDVTQNGNEYSFIVPTGDTVITVYGTYNGNTYRFKDIPLKVSATNDQIQSAIDTIGTVTKEDAILLNILEAAVNKAGMSSDTLVAARSTYNELVKPDGVYLDSLSVVGAPAIELKDGYSDYKVNLYQYQRTIQILAKAQEGLTIKVDGMELESGVKSQAIDVKLDETKTIAVSVSDGTTEAVYNVEVTRPAYPDIYITEVICNGVTDSYGENDEYDIIEIYNASGRELDLSKYSIGYKVDFVQTEKDAGKTDWPYYFTGNTQAFNGIAWYTAVNQITKYATTMNETEPDSIVFPADSTMVIWIKTTKSTSETRNFDTLISAVENYALTYEGNKVLPNKNQIVVAEVPVGNTIGYQSERANTLLEDSVKNFYLRNNRDIATTIEEGYASYYRNWLFVLNEDAVADSLGQITEAGNDIHSAANFLRMNTKDNGKSTLFVYDVEGGKSVIPNNDVCTNNGLATSDEQSYNLYNTLGAIEYMQKPLELSDEIAATVEDNSAFDAESGSVDIQLNIADNTDIRYIELYVKTSMESSYTKLRKDLVLETTALSETGTATDLTSYSYEHSLTADDLGYASKVFYYGHVYDGNGNITEIGTQEEPCVIQTAGTDGAAILLDVSAYKGNASQSEWTIPEQNGAIFAGWFADQDCTTPYTGTTGNAYAKFLDENVLTAKKQFASDLSASSETTKIRFLTAVDSKKFQCAGFEVKVTGTDNKDFNLVEKIAYTYILVDGETDETLAQDVFETADAKYFVLHSITGIPKSAYGNTFSVTPYWITMDGTKVTGIGQSFTISDELTKDSVARIESTASDAIGGYAYYDSLTDAISAVGTTATNIELIDDVEVSSLITIDGEKNITITDDGNERTIYRSSDYTKGRLFSITGNAALTLKSKAEDDTNPKLILSGNNVSASAGQMIIVGSSTSDTYKDNSLTIGKGVVFQDNISTSGAGGAIAVWVGSMTMNGGTIMNCSATGSSGGALNVASGTTFTMNGGTITGNTAKTVAGGINVANGGTFIMNGGIITENTATTRGGGIQVTKNGSFTMNGGTITGNIATEYGGGVSLGDGLIMTMTGGSISGNTAMIGGNDIEFHYASDTLKLDGTVEIGDVYFYAATGSVIQLTEKFAVKENTTIGITVPNATDDYLVLANTGNIYSDEILNAFTVNTTGYVLNNTGVLKASDN